MANDNEDSHQFFFEIFTVCVAVADVGYDYICVKAEFLEKFARLVELGDVVRESLDATMDEKNLAQSLY